MSRYPELPPHYAYQQEGRRIYITYPKNGCRWRLQMPNSTKYQYWHQHVNGALAAWKHAYECLKGQHR